MRPVRTNGRWNRGGVILLESLVALALMAAATATAMALASADQDEAQRIIARSQEISRASAFLDVVTLWPREDFDRRLGTHPQGPYSLSISRPLETMYVIELRDRVHANLLLETAVFRAEDARADQ
jgi:type II secretory pathway pseudopilin PulG